MMLTAEEKAETLEFVIDAAIDSELGVWLEEASSHIDTPVDRDGTIIAMGRLMQLAKADGVYPIKPKV